MPLTPLLKLADFGLGGVAAVRAAARSRIGTTTIDFLSLADQASLFRGAGTPLYMSPEQRRGAPPDPRHDLYALGVVWFQLLVGDVSRELHHGWAKELAVRFGVPAGHIGLIEQCVGWFDERPKDANELLPLLRTVTADPSPRPPPRNGEGEEDPSPGSSGSPPPRGEGLGEGSLTPTTLAASQITPAPVPPTGVSEGRRRGLVAALARLQSAYAELDDLKHWRFNTTLRNGFLVGLLVGWLVGEFVYANRVADDHFPLAAFRAPTFDWLSVVFGVGAGLAVWGAYVWVIRSGLLAVAADLRGKADAMVGEITLAFPAEVGVWGGAAALRHPPTARRLAAEAGRVPGPAGPGADDLADPTRRAVLVGRIGEHLAALAAEAAAARNSWLGLVALWAVAVPLAAYFVGGEVEAAVLDARADRPPADRRTAYGLAAGAAAGLAAAGFAWVVMAAVRGIGRREAAASGDRLAADYPVLVDGWGGRGVLDSREAVRRLREELEPPAGPAPPPAGPSVEDLAAEPTRKVLLVARLRDHDKALDNAGDATGVTWALGVGMLGPLAAFGAGAAGYHTVYRPGYTDGGAHHPPSGESQAMLAAVPAGLVGFALVCWVMWVVRRHFRRRAEASRDRFAADYPRLVDGWGGTAVLNSRETVGALIRVLEPESAARPGWLRRLFGL